MMDLPLGSKEVYLWRLDRKEHSATWFSGIGAELGGGRWNSKGVKAVYSSADPSTAILEVAVHKGFRALDAVPHVLTGARVIDLSHVHRVTPDDVPNPNWLVPGTPSLDQQKFGDDLLALHPFILIPSAVSRHSWNIIMNPDLAEGLFEVVRQERFALDTRLNPPVR
ncbi:hypothetical protein HK44_000975 [Pseudomonas fluorescens HK44]|uniref:RES domain-containing protein n=2 Tax=Pseudomonas fluorescens TaxID=294 RepID=A0A010TB98_PSEFL|nr:RES domain-containing protein [Pseudomonas fluorescens]EXF94562.1 hypothetical protein HK44_000975 [Pseudomonas fluorescens HK44]